MLPWVKLRNTLRFVRGSARFTLPNDVESFSTELEAKPLVDRERLEQGDVGVHESRTI